MPRSSLLWSDDLATASSLTGTQLKTARLTTPLKSGSGSAEMYVQYTGAGYTGIGLDYYIEIDGAGTGEIGSATYKWSDDDGATYDATGVVTHTAFATLNNNIQIRWAQGSGADVTLGDSWRFRALRRDHPQEVTSWRLGTYFEAASAAAAQIRWQYATTGLPTVVALIGHNCSTGTVTVRSYTDAWITVDQTDSFVASATNAIRFLSGMSNSRQYWSIELPTVGGSTPKTAFAFAGSYHELAHEYRDDFAHLQDLVESRAETETGRVEVVSHGVRRRWTLPFLVESETQHDNLRAVWVGVKETNKQAGLLWYDSYENEVRMVNWVNGWRFGRKDGIQGQFHGIVEAEFEEII